MRITPAPIHGAFLIDIEPRRDERGFFARTFCAETFKAYGLNPVVAQCNLTYNHRKGTIRGLHYQIPPAAEAKLLRCTSGSIYEVIIDLRPGSPTYLSHFGVELSSGNRRMFYVPEGCAAGYQALADRSEAAYQSGAFYTPECERGVRYDDPAFGIEWPLPVSIVSAKDAGWADFDDKRVLEEMDASRRHSPAEAR